MERPDSSFLSRHPVLQTQDLDEARECVSQKFCDHKLEINKSGKALSLKYNHVAGQGVSVNYLHYGTNVSIDPGMLNSFYLLQIPLSGHASVQHRGEDIMANVNTATLLNPDRPTMMRWTTNCRKLLLQIDKDHLDNVAQGLTGIPLPGPVRFKTGVDLTSDSGVMLKRIVMKCANAIDHGHQFQGPEASCDIPDEIDLASSLLMLQESNVSHMVHSADIGTTTSSLRMAIEYIHENLHEIITLRDVAKHAHVSVRALQNGFRQHYGLTPMKYVKNARLDVARYKLSARQNTPPVTHVALDSGFSHMGRFSAEYKARFGCTPKCQVTA